MIASTCNYPYLTDFIQKADFEKEIDLVVYKLNVPDKTPDLYSRILERTTRNNPGLTVIDFKKRKKERVCENGYWS